jgi:hypothetical protein
MYHGGLNKIAAIDLSKCRDHTDFGKGFYVTKFREQAEYWAKRQGEKANTQGEVTEFTIYNGLFTDQLFKALQFRTYSEEWLNFVVMNRDVEHESPVHDYDIVEGPIANDNVAREVAKYLDGEISRIDFLKQLTYHKETHQVCFCTYRSLLAIKPIHGPGWFEINTATMTILTTLMLENKINETQAANTLYASKIFAELIKPDSNLSGKSWQEVYELLKKELGDK